MAYKEQLVIRAKTEESAEAIRQVKAMANAEGSTISNMAIRLLMSALGLRDATEFEKVAEAELVDMARESEEESLEKVIRRGLEEDPDSPPPYDSGTEEDEWPEHETLSDEELEASDAESPEGVADRALGMSKHSGVKLIGQYARNASFADMKIVRDRLRERLPIKVYDDWSQALQRNPDYQTYRRRAISGD